MRCRIYPSVSCKMTAICSSGLLVLCRPSFSLSPYSLQTTLTTFTGRTMELGRDLFIKWGYTRIDELIWVKINQLQRLIHTGRTGHWLNHTKEHCLVGRKGKPLPSAGLDCDVLVSEMREISQVVFSSFFCFSSIPSHALFYHRPFTETR